MARKSRVVIPALAPVTQADEGILTAIYARKSMEDMESLETQIELLKNYINESDDLKLYKIYADNGFTGTNLERPALKEMLEDMKAGKFKAVIVKDGSRLGRNYLEAGTLIELTFPEYGIRFVSVNDHYDSASERAEVDGFSLPFKNLVNEQYSKDLSRKLSPAFRAKQIAGEHIGAYAPYGYMKSKEDRHKLIIDEETAPVVLRIFEMKAVGFGNGSIAGTLNSEDILSPFAYRYEKKIVKAEKYKDMKWKPGTISNIVTNQMYIGHMVQGVHRQSLSNREKPHLLKSDEWIIVENTHEPIVSQELFDEVQKVVADQKAIYKEKCEKASHSPTVNLFRKKIYCADCGRAMQVGIARNSTKTNYYYRCKHASITKGMGCQKRSVNKEVIEKTVFETIDLYKSLFAEIASEIKKYNKSVNRESKLQKLQSEKETLEIQRSHYLKIAGSLYDDYEEGILDIEEYEYASKEYKQKILECNNEITELAKCIATYNDEMAIGETELKLFQTFDFSKGLTQEMVDAFVEKIEVHRDGNLEIKFNFQDEYLAALSILDERKGGCA